MAMQFNTALRVAQDDEVIIATLRKEAEEARADAITSKKQADAASSIINSLKLEINSLKKKLNDSHINDTSSLIHGSDHTQLLKKTTSYMIAPNSSILSAHSLHDINVVNLGAQSDREVEEIFQKIEDIPLPSYIPDSKLEISSFQKWKIHNFLYTSDTPCGSENFDVQAVERLESLILNESMNELSDIPRPRTHTKSSIIKTNRLAIKQGNKDPQPVSTINSENFLDDTRQRKNSKFDTGKSFDGSVSNMFGDKRGVRFDEN